MEARTDVSVGKSLKGNSKAFTYAFLATVLLFGIVNIIDNATGQQELTKNYPLFVFLIWTAAIASLMYLGFRVVFWINAIPMYGIMIYSIFNHEEQELNGALASLQWLIGSFPLPPNIMIFVPAFVLLTVIIQLIILRIRFAKGNPLEDE